MPAIIRAFAEKWYDTPLKIVEDVFAASLVNNLQTLEVLQFTFFHTNTLLVDDDCYVGGSRL